MTDEPKDIVLTITLDPNGHLKADGPIQNEPLTFWMLDKAKDTIKAYNMTLAMQERQKAGKSSNIISRIFKK
jgi:hypothetical protein